MKKTVGIALALLLLTTLAFASEPPNTFFAGPCGGSVSKTPGFRIFCDQDLAGGLNPIFGSVKVGALHTHGTGVPTANCTRGDTYDRDDLSGNDHLTYYCTAAPNVWGADLRVGSGARGLEFESGGAKIVVTNNGGVLKFISNSGTEIDVDDQIYITGALSLANAIWQNAGSAPTQGSAATGIGSTGTASFEGNSNRSNGVVTLSPSGSGIAATGTVTVTFGTNYPGGNIGISLTPMNGTGTWTAAPVAWVSARSVSGFTITWVNGGATALTSGSTYLLHYWVTNQF